MDEELVSGHLSVFGGVVEDLRGEAPVIKLSKSSPLLPCVRLDLSLLSSLLSSLRGEGALTSTTEMGDQLSLVGGGGGVK